MSILSTRPKRCKLCGGKLHRRDLRCVDCGASMENPGRQFRIAMLIMLVFAVFCGVLLFLLSYLFSKS